MVGRRRPSRECGGDGRVFPGSKCSAVVTGNIVLKQQVFRPIAKLVLCVIALNRVRAQWCPRLRKLLRLS